jgi:2-dehydro-3-deoxyphosphogluconate aldolase/(4S)-4-hydroxy-2-oxoglutarate aldolase
VVSVVNLRDVLARERVLAIVRGSDPTPVRAALAATVEAGVRVAEVSLTTPDALTVVADAVRSLDALIGVGTARTADDVRGAVDAGAGFVVTPALGPALDEALRLGVPVAAGALTPTEVAAAHAAGADVVKLFPASLGGPGYLRALRDPFPDVPLVPVGGVEADQVSRYLDAGAVAVGVGSPLFGDATAGGDLGALADRTRRLLGAACER